jgi:hypothetical protein
MAITNGYCTLAELKSRLFDTITYRNNTISFAASGSIISDTAGGLGQFDTGQVINVTTTGGSNTGNYTIATGGNNTQIVVTGVLTTYSSASAGMTTITSATKDDAALEAVITAVSRRIDKHCGRRFFTTAADETRYFTAEHDDVLDTGDLISITGLYTDDNADGTYEYTWTTGSVSPDIAYMPLNASLDSEPYTWIQLTDWADYAFPVGNIKGVKITGKFGWSSCPDAVREACIIQSMRLFKRKDAPFGIAGSNEFGTLQVVPQLDPDVKFMLEPYVNPMVTGI